MFINPHMATTTKPTSLVGFQADADYQQIIDALAILVQRNRSGVLRMAVRALAEQEGIDLPPSMGGKPASNAGSKRAAR